MFIQLELYIQNLPRDKCYKPVNIIAGIIQGPKEPSLTMNSYLTPLVLELQEAWLQGFEVTTPQNIPITVKTNCLMKFTMEFGKCTD